MHCLSKRNLYFRELTRGRTGSPEHPSENSKEMNIQGTHARPDVRPNIHQKIEEMVLCM